MQITDLIGLLGGLALFLYGMNMMSNGLEAAAGNKMKLILEKLTANRFLGVVVGALVTAVVQSSSATTVMVVGFVNSGLMTLNQAVWLIMGANIGTTITGQLVALDIGAIAPLFCFLGVAMISFLKNPKIHNWAMIPAGLGMLFIGMDMMSASMSPLRDSELFVNIVSTFSNPLVGIAVGAIFTALIQSSSASVGILQALAIGGVVQMDTAVYVLFGQNIGTCITSLLASIGTARAAKRTTCIHLMFNLIGTAIFTIIAICFPLVELVESFTPGDVTKQIANMHTLFNVVTTLLLLPLGNYMAKLTYKFLPEVPEEIPTEMHLEYLDDAAVMAGNGLASAGSSILHIQLLKQETLRMLSMAKEATVMGYDTVMNNDASQLDAAEKLEEYLDYLNKEISHFISHSIPYENNDNVSTAMSRYYNIVGNIERIGDHANNISNYISVMKDKNIVFSQEAISQLGAMKAVSVEAIERLEDASQPGTLVPDVSVLEDAMDDMTVMFRQNHVDRMKAGTCSEDACILFSELLTDFERIGDHALNIAEQMTKLQAVQL